MKQPLKPLLFGLLALLLAGPLTTSRLLAHGGDDHGEARPSTVAGATSFSTHALSDKFEVLLRYEPLQAGQPAHLRLFVADYATNAPVPAAAITLTTPEDAALRWTVKAQEPGIYVVEGQFPANRKYSFAANIVAGSKADLLLLEGVDVGRKLPVAAPAPAAPSPFGSAKNLLFVLLAFVAGVVLTAVLLRRRPAAAASTSTPVVYENQA